MTLDELNTLDLRQINDWPKHMQWLLLGVLCISLFVVAYVLLIQDQQDALQRLVNHEQSLRKTFESRQAHAANLPYFRAQLASMEQAFAVMLQQLPDQAGVADLLAEVSQTGLSAGLQFVLFQPQVEVKQAFYAELPIKLRVLGRYHQFGAFISGLAALPRIVTLHNISIQPQADRQQKEELLVMEVIAKTYRYLGD